MAGKIPQSFIDELLDRVDIVEVIDGRVPLKKSGKNYSACCPFHDEKTPSFSVSPDKQFYYCFGCGASGSAIGFLMEYDRLEFPQAIESLAQQLGLEVPREAGSFEESRERKDIYTTLEKAASFYQEQLRSHKDASRAQEYLQNRGLVGQVAHRFGMGFAPAGWDNLLGFLGKDEESRRLLLKSGMVVHKEDSNKTYDRFRDRIMFPIRDVRGRVIAFGGRVLGDEKPKYLNSPETEVFHKARELYGLYEANKANRHLQRLLVTEGYMDVVALAQHGIEFAVATLGTAAGQAHLEKAFRYAPEVVFCFDGDEAGLRAAERALEASLPVLGEGRQVRFMFLPEGEDPDTLVRSKGPEAFLQRMETAMPLSEYLFNEQAKGLDLGTAEGRATLVSRVVPLLRKVPENVYKAQLKNLLASQSQTDVAILNELLAESQPEQPPENDHYGDYPDDYLQAMDAVQADYDPEPSTASAPTRKYRQFTLAEEAASLLLQHSAFVEHCEDIEKLEKLERDDASLLLNLVALLQESPQASLNKIMGLWHSKFGSQGSDQLYSLAARETLIPAVQSEQHFKDILQRLYQQVHVEIPLDVLIEKARSGTITEDEKRELNRLAIENRRPEKAPETPEEGRQASPEP